MPMSKDEQGGGTNADGSKSAEYCSRCYQHGQFTQPNMTADQMIDLVQDKMKEMHIPKFLARYFTKGIPNLKRWQQS